MRAFLFLALCYIILSLCKLFSFSWYYLRFSRIIPLYLSHSLSHHLVSVYSSFAIVYIWSKAFFLYVFLFLIYSFLFMLMFKFLYIIFTFHSQHFFFYSTPSFANSGSLFFGMAMIKRWNISPVSSWFHDNDADIKALLKMNLRLSYSNRVD